LRQYRRFVAVLVWAALFAHAAASSGGAAPAQLARAAPIRIMALGDSITAGVGTGGARVEDGGYRGALGALLERHGYRAVFVGSRSDYSSRIVNRAHEGWPGYVLRSFPSDPGPGQLYGPVIRNALRRNDPDVVLLMAGTNDLLRMERHEAGYTLANIMQSMDLVIDEILTEKPSAFVIVAPVVDSPKLDACALQSFAGEDRCDGLAAQSVRSLVDAYAQKGFNISYAPGMVGAVPRDHDHFPDGIHPCGAGGYIAIANVWFDAIERLMQAPSSDVAADETVR
jgi:lysophospholipase L1-like esterase